MDILLHTLFALSWRPTPEEREYSRVACRWLLTVSVKMKVQHPSVDHQTFGLKGWCPLHALGFSKTTNKPPGSFPVLLAHALALLRSFFLLRVETSQSPRAGNALSPTQTTSLQPSTRLGLKTKARINNRDPSDWQSQQQTYRHTHKCATCIPTLLYSFPPSLVSAFSSSTQPKQQGYPPLRSVITPGLIFQSIYACPRTNCSSKPGALFFTQELTRFSRRRYARPFVRCLRTSRQPPYKVAMSIVEGCMGPAPTVITDTF